MSTGNIPLSIETTNISTQVSITASYGGSGSVVSDTTDSISVGIVNLSQFPIEYKVDSGPWVTLGSYGNSTLLRINLSTATLNLRKGLNAGATGVAQLTIESMTGNVLARSDAVGGGILVATSRALAAADNGKVLECTATVTITVPIGLPSMFGCVIIPSGTTSIASSGGALLNGATTTLTRAAASNAMFAITGRKSATDSYVVTGS